MPGVSKEEPGGQSREQGAKGRGEFRQVVRSWITWGLKARERGLDFTLRDGKT